MPERHNPAMLLHCRVASPTPELVRSGREELFYHFCGGSLSRPLLKDDWDWMTGGRDKHL